MRIKKNVVFQEEPDGTAILFNSDTGVAFELNSTAREIWLGLGDRIERSEILERLYQLFNSSFDQLGDDFDKFIGQLQEHGFLE